MKFSLKRKNRKKNISPESLKSGYVFMHIPKTGGSSMGTMCRKLIRNGHNAPAKLGHKYTLRAIAETFPKHKVCMVLRDPIERAASGFLSRMRMGRPTYNNKWRTGEAIAFSFFDSPVSLLNAIASDDERLKSATIFAFSNISHLRSNYVRFFESVEYINDNLDRLGIIGSMNNYDAFVTATFQKTAPEITDISEYYIVKHVSKQSSKSILDSFDASAQKKIKKFFAEEYKIYNRLLELVNC